MNHILEDVGIILLVLFVVIGYWLFLAMAYQQFV